jgi:hypothetical protein
LFIIDECYTGIGPTGAQAFYRTRVYDWNGTGFTHLEAVSEKIGNADTAAKVRKKLPEILKTVAEARPIPIQFKPGATTAQTTGKFTKRGEHVIFTVKAEKDQRMIVNIIPVADGLATAGVVTAPSGAEDGQPGGLVFNSLLKETGEYQIRVSQRPTEFSLPAEFMVEVIILPSYWNADIVNEQPSATFQKLDPASFNQKIEKAAAADEMWVKMPTRVVAELIGKFDQLRTRKIEMESELADATDALTVTVTDDGYADDSVRGEKFKFELKVNEQGVWKVVSAEKTRRCWPDHGHQDYSPAPCL